MTINTELGAESLLIVPIMAITPFIVSNFTMHNKTKDVMTEKKNYSEVVASVESSVLDILGENIKNTAVLLRTDYNLNPNVDIKDMSVSFDRVFPEKVKRNKCAIVSMGTSEETFCFERQMKYLTGRRGLVEYTNSVGGRKETRDFNYIYPTIDISPSTEAIPSIREQVGGIISSAEATNGEYNITDPDTGDVTSVNLEISYKNESSGLCAIWHMNSEDTISTEKGKNYNMAFAFNVWNKEKNDDAIAELAFNGIFVNKAVLDSYSDSDDMSENHVYFGGSGMEHQVSCLDYQPS